MQKERRVERGLKERVRGLKERERERKREGEGERGRVVDRERGGE